MSENTKVFIVRLYLLDAIATMGLVWYNQAVFSGPCEFVPDKPQPPPLSSPQFSP